MTEHNVILFIPCAIYRKYSERQVWADNVDPDQLSCLIRVYTKRQWHLLYILPSTHSIADLKAMPKYK